MNEELNIIWKPQPKQALALSRKEDEILYGGSRGGGKTDSGMAFLLYNIHHPRFRALVIRKNSDDLKDWVDRAKRMYAGARPIFTGNPSIIRFPSGAIIRTGHLNDENSYMKYQGQEFQNILIEELSQIARESDYVKLIGSCRSTVPELKPQVFCTTNPDDPGIEWIKERWKIPEIPDFNQIYTSEIKMTGANGEEYKKKLVFIPAKVEDNPALMKADPNYVAYLESLQKINIELYDAWRNGNWKGFGVEGSYYRNQLTQMEIEKRVALIPYDELLPVHTFCDLGIGDSFSIGYFQVYGTQWRWIDYDEFEGESIGSAIQRMKDKKYNFGYHFAPHDIEVRELGTGKTRWEVAKEHGVTYQITPNIPLDDGINAVRMSLSVLWVNEDKCKLGLKRLRSYHKEFDDKRGIYKNNPVHDINSHCADMIRYWAVAKDEIVTFTQKTTGSYTPNWVQNRWKK